MIRSIILYQEFAHQQTNISILPPFLLILCIFIQIFDFQYLLNYLFD